MLQRGLCIGESVQVTLSHGQALSGRLLRTPTCTFNVAPAILAGVLCGLLACVKVRKCEARYLTSPVRRFMVGSSDSDSEDNKRVVRSAKDKRFEELQATCDEIRVRSRASSLTTEQISAALFCSKRVRP